MTSIQNNPRFKKDIDRYLSAIKECQDPVLRLELTSLYDRFIRTVKQIDAGLEMLVSERITNDTAQTETKIELQKIRQELEKAITSKVAFK